MINNRTFFPLSKRRRLRRILVTFAGFMTISMCLRASFYAAYQSAIIEGTKSYSKAFVVASLEKDDTSWIHEHLSGWNVSRYVVDNPSAPFTVPKNKGREAMVYLTYIIDAYDDLPDVMVFMHSQRYQWHNDDPIYDGVPLLQNLQLPYIVSQGYANLRCVWTLGCPFELRFDLQNYTDLEEPSKSTQIAYPDAFQELFPGEPIPPVVGVACCAQFALTREKIHRRPLEDYQRYRQWLLNTPLNDHISGRVFEYSWHMIFGESYVHCPSARDCYCNTFGLCNLECRGADKCGERWPFPPYTRLPQGWPRIGWDEEGSYMLTERGNFDEKSN